jgi:formylglycine-generating enzyme required for sulfatase activity
VVEHRFPVPEGIDPELEHWMREPDPEQRATFFRELGLRRADTRLGVGLRNGVPDIVWRRVPAGSFHMGGDPLALYPWPGRTIAIPTDYWMAAYPVTVAQFGAFVEDDGYGERWRSCWTRFGWEWKGSRSKPDDWEDTTRHISNYPVEVTWYVAAAFAQWVDEQRRAGKLALPRDVPESHVIRLPDEAEWERAARYPDGRWFPWGNSYQAGCANIDETSYYERVGPYYLARLTAVGIYPRGRNAELGIDDLSGNVSEWCLTEWDWSEETRYSAKNNRDSFFNRVVRSGGWVNSQQFARAATRYWGDPDPDGQYNPDKGFRLVIGAPFPPG